MIEKEIPRSCCKYRVMSSYHLTVYHIAMISIMSWEEHHSKTVMQRGRTTQWSKTSQNGLPSLSVRSDSLSKDTN